eukprot:10718027-Alexandrium_andersonii.AAC.1
MCIRDRQLPAPPPGEGGQEAAQQRFKCPSSAACAVDPLIASLWRHPSRTTTSRHARWPGTPT